MLQQVRKGLGLYGLVDQMASNPAARQSLFVPRKITEIPQSLTALTALKLLGQWLFDLKTRQVLMYFYYYFFLLLLFVIFHNTYSCYTIHTVFVRIC